MRISRDVTSDESRPFYPRPSSSTFLVEDISFLMFPNNLPNIPTPCPTVANPTPSSPTISSPSLSHNSPPSSPMSNPSLSPSVIHSHPTFPFHYTRCPRVVNDSIDVPSTYGVPSRSTYGLRPRPCPHLNAIL